jgi:acyl carrier protein
MNQLEVILSSVRAISKGKAVDIDTKLVTELDFDSLAVLELVSTIKIHFGVDLLDDYFTVADIQTARSIDSAVTRYRAMTQS